MSGQHSAIRSKPDIGEQTAIVSYLDITTAKIDCRVSKRLEFMPFTSKWKLDEIADSVIFSGASLIEANGLSTIQLSAGLSRRQLAISFDSKILVLKKGDFFEACFHGLPHEQHKGQKGAIAITTDSPGSVPGLEVATRWEGNIAIVRFEAYHDHLVLPSGLYRFDLL